MNQLREIREGLKHGDIKAIAIELGVTAEFVGRVLRGRDKSDKVMSAAIEMVDINKKNAKELQRRIDKVLAK